MRKPNRINMSGALLAALFFFSSLVMTAFFGGGMEVKGAESYEYFSASDASEPMSGIADPDSEVRGIWIASVLNINFPSARNLSADKMRAELDDIVKTAKDANLNAIYFQVRPACDALYDSKIFPTSKYLSGTLGWAADEDFDALAYILKIAHAEGIKVHAWVNPLRVTTGTAAKPEVNLDVIPASSPARQHPEWVVEYWNALYFDCGIPEVRALVADGVREIAENYDVDGIIYDDYFYPYQKYDENNKIIEFDDAETYKKYNAEGYSLANFRRDAVNKLIEQSYKAVKSANPDCEFGVAPFGIWRNDNGSNGGSDTGGMESYSAIYCDSVAWVKGGYVDYISPQLYWRFSTSVAQYDELVRWWNTVVDGCKTLDGKQIKLIISHGAYNYATWTDPQGEISRQIEYGRSELTYRGSILYGYAALKANTSGLFDEVKEVFTESIVHSDVKSNGASISVGAPANNGKVWAANTFILGASDPGNPLYYYFSDNKSEQTKVGRTKSGYFNIYVPLDEYKNVITFVNGEDTYVYTIYNANLTPDTGVTPDTNTYVDAFAITSQTPSYAVLRDGGSELSVSCIAPAGCDVTATLGSTVLKLTPASAKDYSKTDKGYVAVKYSGTLTLPKTADGSVTDAGTVTFKLSRTSSGTTTQAESVKSAAIRVLGKDASIPIEIIKDDAELKTATDSWYYDDYSVQVAGVRDEAVWQGNGYYMLRMGGYIAEENVREASTHVTDKAKISSVEIKQGSGTTDIYFKVAANVPFNGTVNSEGFFVFSLYNVDTSDKPLPEITANPLISKVYVYNSTSKANTARYWFYLNDPLNFYGYDVRFENGYLILSLRNPSGLSDDAEKPLSGKVIIVDPGHGGTDNGTPGALRTDAKTVDEADTNLEVALRLQKKLTDLGATVHMTRTEDATVDIYTRMDYLKSIEPDLCLSVHQNALDYSKDITLYNGITGLYWSDGGELPANIISNSLSASLNRSVFRIVSQRLAMCRNPRFPTALIETSFFTCVEEYEVMLSERGIDKTVSGLLDGVLSYFEAQGEYLEKYGK